MSIQHKLVAFTRERRDGISPNCSRVIVKDGDGGEKKTLDWKS